MKLRPLTLDDASQFAKWANNEHIANNLRNSFPYPYTEENAEEFIISVLKAGERKGFCRAIILNDELIGNIAITLQEDVYCKSAEIGYWLAEPYWGKGIMTEAIRKACKEAFLMYDIVRIFAEPFAKNMGSRKALEKAGFELEAILKKSVYKNENLQDSCIYAFVKD